MQTWENLGINIRGATTGEIDTVCPKCSAQRKKKTARCLSVNIDAGTFLCHHCGHSGGLGIGQDIGHKKPIFRLPPPPEERDIDPVIAWFKGRGIPQEVVRRNKITGATVWMPQVEGRCGVIAFPYLRNGIVVNYKYRDRAKNFRMEKNAERILYGYDDISDENCVVVEGEIDKLSVEVAGFTSCVSVPDGAPSPTSRTYAGKFTFLDDPRLESVRRWVIAVDSDAPGVRLEQELVRRLGVEKCVKVSWPEGCKDANEALATLGSEGLQKIIEAAKPYPIEGVFEVKDLTDQLDLLYKQGLRRGLSTGSRNLDEFYTVRAGEWTVITGTPGSGKSNFVDWLGVNLAKEHSYKFAIFSPENQPLQNHLARIIEHFTRIPFRDGPTPRLSMEQMHVARDWAQEFFQFILPGDSEWTIENILQITLKLVRRHGINGIIIDPWNELEHSRPAAMTETEYVSVSLKRIRQFARLNSCHIFLVAHPAKLYKNRDTGQYPIPTLYDISGSAHFRNKADNGLVVWRDFNDPSNPMVQIHIQKIRFREIGKLGMCTLKYIPATGSYEDSTPPPPRIDPPSYLDEDDEPLPF